MDLTTIIFTSLLALGVFTMDAWYHGKDLNLEINIPKGYGASESSITDTVAENIFLNEVADMQAVPTFIDKPAVRSTDEPTVVSMIGEMLGLKKLTLLAQIATGAEPLVVNGSLTKRKDRYQLVLVSNPDAGQAKRLNLVVETIPDEPVTQMIQRAATQAMLNYEDYMVCLYLLTRSKTDDLKLYGPMLERPGLEGLDLLVQKRMLMTPAGGIVDLEESGAMTRRRAMFTNLRGMIALEQGDVAKAAGLFQDAIAISSDFPIAQLNYAFILTYGGKYQQAIDTVRAAIASGKLGDNPALLAPAHTLWAVAAWGMKQKSVATEHFAKANEIADGITVANYYWGDMLIEQGNVEQGNAKRQIALEHRKQFNLYAESAILWFRLTPFGSTTLKQL